MKYTKPPLSFDEQVAQLQKRGMLGDPDAMKRTLGKVNYYRLSAYWYPFRKTRTDDDFRQGTHFDEVWRRYRFDRELRLLVIDALERIEIAVRTQVAYHHAMTHGAFAYVEDQASLPGLNPARWSSTTDKLKEQFDRSPEDFVTHFKTKYGDQHALPPIWIGIELMSFGNVVTIAEGLAPPVVKKVAGTFQVGDAVFLSWIKSLSFVRNVCAHHSRLWNRVLAPPKLPWPQRNGRHNEWHVPVAIPTDRVFCVLTICNHWLTLLSPGHTWAKRVRKLLDAFSTIPSGEMGFPADWLKSPLWANTT